MDRPWTVLDTWPVHRSTLWDGHQSWPDGDSPRTHLRRETTGQPHSNSTAQNTTKCYCRQIMHPADNMCCLKWLVLPLVDCLGFNLLYRVTAIMGNTHPTASLPGTIDNHQNDRTAFKAKRQQLKYNSIKFTLTFLSLCYT